MMRNNEKRKRPIRSDRCKTDWRSGAFCHTADTAYDPRTWSLELDNNEKRRAPAAETHKLFYSRINGCKNA